MSNTSPDALLLTPEAHATKLSSLSFYREEIKHEFSLLSNRVSAYLTSQSFLIIAFASSMNNTNPRWGSLFRLTFPCALAILGITLSIQAWLGIRAACDTIILWHIKQNALFENDPAMESYRVERSSAARGRSKPVDRTHERSLWFALGSPWTFAIAWICFEALALFLHFRS